ncbi:hypothetical protein CFP56_015748 [Quercus suber]|uniref:R13L1/DRL21-like LRR repeat region domain-containing protein n=1 Tax=Quercus suber TaxID=58331 RepID=A0AAW0KRY8_QUESU
MGELENLNHIQGSLRIQGLKNVVDLGEVKRAQLKKKIRLSVLLLHFDMLSLQLDLLPLGSDPCHTLQMDDDQDNEFRLEINGKDDLIEVSRIEDSNDEENGTKHQDL